MYLERINNFFTNFFIFLFRSWLLDLNEECLSFLPDTELHITSRNDAAIHEDSLLANFFNCSPISKDAAFNYFHFG